MKSLILVAILALTLPLSNARIYERCELAKELLNTYGRPRSDLGNWVCLIQWESSYNTAATNVNTNESTDYGLYEINDYYWCFSSNNPTYNDCNIDCANLIDDDIADDVACSDIIYARHGFTAWYGWQDHCQGQDVESYVSDCGLD